MSTYAGADWIKHREKDVSPLGERVADLLGELFRGIYHLYEGGRGPRVDWSDNYCIEISVPATQLATVDFDGLTQLVLLCHEQAIRCQIGGSAPRLVKLQFHQRKREGSHMEAHPTMEQALAAFNARRRR